MMDFNQILLFASLGVLAVVLLFALLGFLVGLKRELKCTAVFIVLLVLFWLVFGDAATFLNNKALGSVAGSLLEVEGDSISTLWDVIVAFAKDLIPNGEALLVEGKETYALFHSIVSAVLHFVGLLAGTIIVLVISPIIRFITGIIGMIIRGIKKGNAKRRAARAAASGATEEVAEVEEEKVDEQIIIPSSESSADEAVITKEANELPVKPAGKRRLWGALTGALKGAFVVMILCAPLSGLVSILNTASPKTQALLSNVMNGEMENVSQSNDVVETVFDFAEAYNESALGQFIEAPGFFFGSSFSEQMFDNMFKVETKNQSFYLTDEIKTVIETVNALNGKIEVGTWSTTEVTNALNELKDSKLIVEVMPAIIEVAYEVEDIQAILEEAGQEDAFLDLRYNNWKNDISLLLDFVAEVYALDFFAEDFDLLKLDAEQLRVALDTLSDTNIVNEGLDIALAIVFTMDSIEEMIGQINYETVEIDWKQEFDSLVDIYVYAQEVLAHVDDLQFNDEAIKAILTNPVKLDSTFAAVKELTSLQIMEAFGTEVVFGYIENSVDLGDEALFTAIMSLEPYVQMSDLRTYVDVARSALNLVDFSNYPTVDINPLKLDVAVLRSIVEKLFSTDLTLVAINTMADWALAKEEVSELTKGALAELQASSIDWKSDLFALLDVYEYFLGFGFESMDDINANLDLVEDILSNSDKAEIVANILAKVAETDLFNLLSLPVVQAYVDEYIANNFEHFNDILDITEMSVEQWQEDFRTLVDIATKVTELNLFDFINDPVITNLDITSPVAIKNIKDVIKGVFALNILGDDEFKTEVLVASINQFTWTTLPADFDASAINWDNERDVLVELVNVYVDINGLEEFDVYSLDTLDLTALLENDDFFMYVVDGLEALVESNVLLELLPGLLDHHVLPHLNGLIETDDETLFSDLLHTLSSEDIVREIIKLIDVVKAAIDMNLLDVAEEGVQVIDIANTEAIKTIISGILESRFLDGHEGRIIRVFLKAFNLLDINKISREYADLVHLDYTGETEILLDIVDTLAPVLKDPDFSLFTKDGSLNLDLEFWLQNEKARIVLDAVEKITGSYEDDSVTGSKLLEVLLPLIYEQYIEGTGIVPEDFVPVLEILDVTNASGAELMNDLSCLVYILDQSVTLGVHTLLGENAGVSIATHNSITAIHKILDALHDMQLFEGHEAEFMSWALNYAADKIGVEIETNPEDFENVNWKGQKDFYKEIVSDLGAFLRNNNLYTIGDINEFIQNKQYDTKEFITQDNASDVLVILDKLVDIQIFDAISPLIVKYAISKVEIEDLSLDYVLDFTNSQINEDLHALIEVLQIAVNEIDIVNLYHNDFNGDIALPEVESVASIVSILFDLHLVNEEDGAITNYAFEKALGGTGIEYDTLVLKIKDFDLANIDWHTEKEVFVNLVYNAFDLLEVNNIETVGNLRTFISEKWYTYPTFFRNETGYVLADVVRSLSGSQIIENVIGKVWDFAVEKLVNVAPFDVSYMNFIETELIMEDFNVLADIIDLAVDFGAFEYIRTDDIAYMDLEYVAQIIEKLPELNVIDNVAQALLYDLYKLANKYVKQVLPIQITNIQYCDLVDELNVIANAVREAQGILEAGDLVALSSVLEVVKEQSFKERAFYNEGVYVAAINVAIQLANLNYVEQLAKPVVAYGLETIADKGVEFDFIDLTQYNAELIVKDIKVVLEMAKSGYALGVVDYAFTKDIPVVDITPVADMLEVAKDLNILELYSKDFVAYMLDAIKTKTGFDTEITYEDLEQFFDYKVELDNLKDVVVELQDVINELHIISLTSALDKVDEVKSLLNKSVKDLVNKVVSEQLAYEVLDVVSEALDFQLVSLVAELGVDMFVSFADSKNIDISYLSGIIYRDSLIVADAKLLVEVARKVVEAGALEYYKKGVIYQVEFEPIHDIIDLLAQTQAVNFFLDEFLSLAANCVCNLVKVDLDYNAEDFKSVVLEKEVAALHDVISAIDTLLYENHLFSTDDILSFVKDQKFNNANFFTLSNGYRIEDLIVAIASLQSLEVVLPDLLNAGVDNLKQVDLTFLKDSFTGAELAEDIKIIAHLIPLAIKADFAKVAYGLNIKDLELDILTYQEMVNILKEVNVLNVKWAELAELGTNTVYNMLKVPYSVTVEDFAGIDFAADMDYLSSALGEINVLLENVNAVTVQDALDLTKQLKTEKLVNTKNAYVVLNALEDITSMLTVQALYPTLANVASDKLATMPTDVSYLLEGVAKDELVEDVASILNALNKLVAFGVIDIVFYDGYIGIDNFSAINTALEEILLLNVLEGNYTTLILDVFKALNIETDKYQLTANLEAIDWNKEVESLQAVIEAVRKALVYTEIDKVSKVKSFDVNSLLVIDENTNELLDIVAELLGAIGNDKLVSAVVLPLSNKYMPTLDSKLINLADVHNIYFDGKDLAEDLVSLSEVVYAVRDLDINAVLNKGAVLPYGNLAAIETIIKNTLRLNYLQNTPANPDRVSQLIVAIDGLIPADLSNLDGTNVDFAGDADYIYAAYEYFYNIACHDEWTIQYLEDVKSFKLSNELLKDYHIYQDVLNVLANIMDTTIYSELAPAVVVEVLPKLESKFADIYDVLDLGNYSVAMAKNDLIVLADIVDAINSVNIVNTIELEIYFTSAVNEALVSVIESIADLEVLKGKGAELVNYLADTYINNKIYGDVVITAGLFNGNDVDFIADKDNLVVIINEFFNITNEINVDNTNQLISYVKGLNSFEDTKATLGNQDIVDSLENILYAIADLTVVQGNGYRAAKAGVFKSLAGGALGNVLDFTNISQAEFVEDLYTIAGLLSIANEFGMVDIINDELINYDQADLFEEFFTGLFGLNILNTNLEAIVEYVDTLNLPVSVLALADADLVADAQHISNAYKALVPFLTSNDNPLDRLSVYQALTEKGFVLEIEKSVIYNNLYAFVEAYEELVQLSVLNLMLPTIADKVLPSVPEDYKNLVDATNVDNLTAEEFAEDLAQTAVILRTLVDLGLEDFIKFGKVSLAGNAVSTLNGTETVMSKAEMVTILVDALHAMNVTTSDLVEAVLDKLGVDTTEMELTNIDYDFEIDALNTVIVSLINVLIELGYEDTNAIKDYVMNLNPSNIKEILKDIYADVDLVHFVNIFNAIDNSQFVVEVFKPLYNKYIYPSLKGDLADLANLDSYSKEQLDQDLHALAIIANELYLMDCVPAEMNDKFTHPQVVAGTETIIEALFNLNILDIKLQEIVEFVDTKLGNVDLSGLDLSNVNLSKDGETLKAVAYQMLSVAECLRVDGIYLKHLGNTELVIKAFDVLKAVFDTELYVEVSNWAAGEYLAPKFKDLDFSRENVAKLTHELEETIDALICMGFFSNDKVDFTNKVNTDRLFGLIENVFAPSYTIQTHVNKLKGQMHLIGKVDINYADLDNNNEVNAIKDAYKLFMDLVPEIKGVDNLLDPQVQSDITAAFEQLFVSDLAKQLVLPIASGLVKIYTSDNYMLSVLEGVDHVEFVKQFLPDAFELVEKADDVNALDGSIDYKNTDGVTELFRVLVFAESFKNHTGDIVKFLFALADVDVKAKDFSDINWEDEFYSLEAALDTMHDVLQGLDTSDKETYMNPEFMGALADALPEFDYSNFLPQVVREVATKLLTDSKGDNAAKYTDRLFEESYDNDALMNDYRLLDNILDEVIETGFLDDNIDYGEKGVTALNNLLKLFFELEYRKGMEATLLNFVKVRVSMLDAYTFNYDAVTDWEEEKTPLLAAGDEVVELSKLCPVNEINHDNLRNKDVQAQFVKVVDAMSKSEMGRQFVPQIYELEMEPNLGSDNYEGILDFEDPTFDANLWAGEFDKLFKVYNKLEEYGYTNGSMNLSVADAKQLMIDLFGPSKEEKSQGIYSVANNPEKWLTRLFQSDVVTLPNGAMYNRTENGDIAMFEDVDGTICEWADEPYAIIAVMDAMIAIDNSDVFEYSNVYACQDSAKLEALLNATLNSGILRGTAFQVLVNTLDSNPALESYILITPEFTELLGASYDDYKANYEADKAYFTSAYWNTEYTTGVTYATVWAKAIAAGNQYVASYNS